MQEESAISNFIIHIIKWGKSMGYLWYDLEELKGGQVIEIDVTTAVNVKLMSYDSFSLYRNGLPYRYRGGYVKKTPCHVQVPYDGSWILVFDISYEGYFKVKSVRMLTEQEIESSNDNSVSEVTIDSEEKEAPSEESNEGIQLNKDKIFIVHGHDNRMKGTVARYIKELGFEPIILHEQANRGKTIIEKLENYVEDIRFAFILYSPDDEMKDGKKRARQNVVFEHGLFVGKLTREKVIALCKKDNDIETLSDLSGVIYIKYENGWKKEVERELKAAGLLDANK